MMFLGTQRVNANGNLEIGGCDALQLAQEFGTPLYVMDESDIRTKCREYITAFEARYPKNIICFAGKSFMTLAMCRIVEEEGLNLDVASGGELYVALQADFPRERINLHGNNKSIEELELAIDSKIGHIVVDNFEEISLLQCLAREANRQVSVMVRCAPGVDPHTHLAISTGQSDSKFGFNIADGSALRAVQQIVQCAEFHFDGIHCHVGSQLLDSEAHEGALEPMIDLMLEIRATTGQICSVLNIGGGLGIRYRTEHIPPTYAEFANRLCVPLITKLNAADYPLPTLQQEPGRALVGEAGTTLYTVGVVKTVPILEAPGTRTYVTVDGGLSDNPRPQLYDAVYELIVANKATQPHDKFVTIAGKHCETDTLIKDVLCAEVQSGDTIAVQSTGAYNYVMASNYNKFLRPPIVLVKNGTADLIVERETFVDLVRHDRIPDRLAKVKS